MYGATASRSRGILQNGAGSESLRRWSCSGTCCSSPDPDDIVIGPRLLARNLEQLFSGLILRRLTTGTSWSFVGAICAQGSNVAAAIVVARSLGRVGLGEFSMITSTVLMLGILTELGLGTTATKYVAELRTSNPHRAGRVLGVC